MMRTICRFNLRYPVSANTSVIPVAYPELSCSDWFLLLTTTQQRALLQECKPVSLIQRQYLFHRGDAFNGLFVLLRGSLWISGLDSTGREIGLTVIKPGEWFGEIALFDGQSRTHDVLASEPCRLLRIPADSLYNLLDNDPQWWQCFGQLLTAKVRVLFQSIEDRSQPRSDVRLARKLYELVLRAPDNDGVTTLTMGQEQLGLLLSLSRQKTNQQLKHLESLGILDLAYGKITVLSTAKLKDFAQVSN